MLTVYEESSLLFESLQAGACGYLLKRSPPGKLLEAIRDAHAGGVPLNPMMAAKVARFFQEPRIQGSGVERLSQRERQGLGTDGGGLPVQGDRGPPIRSDGHRPPVHEGAFTKNSRCIRAPRRVVKFLRS